MDGHESVEASYRDELSRVLVGQRERKRKRKRKRKKRKKRKNEMSLLIAPFRSGPSKTARSRLFFLKGLLAETRDWMRLLKEHPLSLQVTADCAFLAYVMHPSHFRLSPHERVIRL